MFTLESGWTKLSNCSRLKSVPWLLFVIRENEFYTPFAKASIEV
jgi:hypothetical protein